MTTLKARRCPCGNTFIPRAADDRHCSACWHAIGLKGGPYMDETEDGIRGGQARTAKNAGDYTSALWWYLVAFLFVAIVVGLYAILDLSLRGTR